jgi:heterodisulfide reductase subunit A-like polyferredoxin
MYRLWKTLLNYILLLGSDAPADLQNGLLESTPATKSILIIGGGNAGLGSLKTFLDVPARIRRDWDIVLYEKRDEIGGIW